VTDQAVETVVRFGGALREAGLRVGSGELVDFSRAASLLGPGDLYWAGRSTLVQRRRDLETYDRVFREFFGKRPAVDVPLDHREYGEGFEQEIFLPEREGQPPREGEAQPPDRPIDLDELEAIKPETLADGVEEGPPGRTAEGEEDPVAGEADLTAGEGTASSVEALRSKSFSQIDPGELAELAEMIARVRLAMPTRRTRRRRGHRQGELDLRTTIRRSFRAGGEPAELSRRTRRHKPRRLILFLDVSGSMAAYSRGLLVLAHAALRAGRDWEAFAFGTRLTRLTPSLKTHDPDEALARASAAVFDWDGGTRIGESLRSFLDGYGHGGMARGAVVVICSDGLEVGYTHVLVEQMQRLSRLAHRVVWLDPLKQMEGYEPLGHGLRAALPYVDVFTSGHSFESVEELVEELARLG